MGFMHIAMNMFNAQEDAGPLSGHILGFVSMVIYTVGHHSTNYLFTSICRSIKKEVLCTRIRC
jgi:hypothetical protein